VQIELAGLLCAANVEEWISRRRRSLVKEGKLSRESCFLFGKRTQRQPFPFASRTRVHRTETLTTVPPDTWVELHDDDIIKMGSSQTFKYRVMIPLSPILVPEIVPASQPHLIKLAFPGSCIARIIGQRGGVINHIKETFK